MKKDRKYPRINQEEYEVLRSYYFRGIMWISRNENGDLVVSKIKPDKFERKWLPQSLDGDWSELRNSETYLFLFIQWTDSEPYFIPDLIKEYEKKKYRFRLGDSEMSDFVDNSSGESCTVFSLIVEEDEEMKKDKEWLREKVETYFSNWWSESDDDMHDLMDNVKRLIDQLDEPEKVVVPEIVAEYIQEGHELGVDLGTAMTIKTELLKHIRDYIKNNEETFARAWLDGFTIANEDEKEQKYYALVKGHEVIGDYANLKYWNSDTFDKRVFLGERDVVRGWVSAKMSKSKWNKLGINDSNADFVKVEEV